MILLQQDSILVLRMREYLEGNRWLPPCAGEEGEEAMDVDVETDMDIDQLPSPPTPLLFPPGLPQPISPPTTEA